MSNKLIKEKKEPKEVKKKNRAPKAYYEGFTNFFRIMHIVVAVFMAGAYLAFDYEMISFICFLYPLILAFRILSFKNISAVIDHINECNDLFSMIDVVAMLASFLLYFKYIDLIEVEWNSGRICYLIGTAVVLYTLAISFRVFVLKYKNDDPWQYFSNGWARGILILILLVISSVGAPMTFVKQGPQYIAAEIEDMDMVRSRSGRHRWENDYYLHVTSDKYGEESYQVSPEDFDKIYIGDEIYIKVYDSIFGYNVRLIELEE